MCAACAVLTLLFAATCGGDDETEQTSCDPCDPSAEYCSEFITDSPTSYSCVPLPAACGAEPTCECIPEEESCESGGCSVNEDGLAVVSCVGG
jgi:hypothetical protein